MKVSVRQIADRSLEQVVLECVSMTPELEEIRDYVEAKGSKINVYKDGNELHQIRREDILYVEAVGELVFAYTSEDVYEMRMRLYEVEEMLSEQSFVRCSKSVILNLYRVTGIRPALNGRFLAQLENGEDVIISRQYAKAVRKCIMEDL